jgi:crotonobetainyl-CoA:carnitine CoA-transferase CaiB-like acyl-CoA transferase
MLEDDEERVRTMPDQALSSIKVLDVGYHIAGSYCTKLLGQGSGTGNQEVVAVGDPPQIQDSEVNIGEHDEEI